MHRDLDNTAQDGEYLVGGLGAFFEFDVLIPEEV